MKKLGLLMIVVFLGLGLMIAGCSKPTAELEKAEQALQAAKDAGAPTLAAADYQAAENKLNAGKSSIDAIKYSQAKTELEEAAQLAEIARQKAVAAKQKPGTPAPVAPVVQKKVETPAAPKSDLSSYTVVQGDCLWKISANRDIYGDGYVWSLIYDANKDQIKNPNLIYPKQVLKIKTNVTDEEKKAARKRAGGK